MKHNILFLLIILFHTTASAQLLTLQQCLELAHNNSIALKRSRIQIGNATLQKNKAQHALLPEVSAGASEHLNFGRGLTSQNTYVDRNTSTTNLSLNASMPLFTGLRITNERKRAHLELEAAKADLNGTIESIDIQVIQAFYELLFQKELQKVSEEQLDLSKYQLHRMTESFKNGKVAQIEVSEAENSTTQDALALTQQENAVHIARLNLSQLLELPSPDSLDIRVITDKLPSIAATSPQIIFQRALKQRASIQAENYRLQAAEIGVKAARAGYYPNLSLTAGIGTSYYKINGTQSNAFNKQLHDNLNKNIGLTLSIPIFDRFNTRNNIRKAKLDVIMQQLQLDEKAKKLYKDIQTAWYNAIAAQNKMKAAEKAAKVAEQTFLLMQKKYEYGKANMTEYNEQRTKYLNARTNSISSSYEYRFRIEILNKYNDFQ